MFISKIKAKIRGSLDIKKLKRDGLKVGFNFNVLDGVIIDPGHCWLITIGNNVTLAPRVHILAHDASTKKIIGYTRIAKVNIGNNVFVGADSIILPGVTIEDNVIIGAGSVVTCNLERNSIYAGNPARKIAEMDDWICRRKLELSKYPVFEEEYIYRNINLNRKKEMIEKLQDCSGYIV